MLPILNSVFSVIFINLLFVINIVTCHISSITYYETNQTDLLTKVLDFNDKIIVGGKNVLLSLDTDLNLISEDKYGPVLDNRFCKPEPEPCEHFRSPTDNVVKVLLRYSKYIFECGSTNQGMCSLRMAGKVSQASLIGNKSNTESYVGGKDTVVAFFSNGRLYTASSYDGREANLSGHFASSRTLTKSNVTNAPILVYTHVSEQSISAVDYDDRSNLKFSYDVQYIYGFSHKNFSYFLSYEPVSTKSTMFETRIARVCQEDLKFTSYSEIALKCSGPTGDDFNKATTAFLSNFTDAQKQRRRDVEPGDASLYITFTKNHQGGTRTEDSGTVMCRFLMSRIEKAFRLETERCLNGELRSRKISKIVGEDAKCFKNEQYVLDEELCNPSTSSYIEGSEVIIGSLKATFKGNVTSLFVTVQHNTPIAFFGTSTGRFVKLNIKSNEAIVLYDVQVSATSIQPSIAWDESQLNLFLLTGNKVVKFPIGSCSLYKTCSECLNHPNDAEPLECGWCDGRCAHQAECDDADIDRLVCPPYIHKISPLAGPIQGNTTITIEGENFGHSSHSSDSTLKVTIGSSVCHVISWNDSNITCKTSPQLYEISKAVEVKVDVIGDGSIDKRGNATSDQLFAFKKLFFYGISPRYGPVAGGSNITAYGENLDIGSEIELKLVGVSCKILVVNSTKITCSTKGISYDGHDVVKGLVQLFVDGYSVTTYPQKYKAFEVFAYFEYMANPVITNIKPRASVKSGGTKLKIIGNKLNSIINPRLVVKISDVRSNMQYEIIKSCTHDQIKHQTGTVMTCPTPSLDGVKVKAPTARVPLEVYIYFIMDGVEDLRDFANTHPRISTILYYPDPKYFTLLGVPIDDPVITVGGENLNLVHSKDDINVTLNGSIPCNVVSLSFSTLKCKIPEAYVPTKPGNHSLLSVKIKDSNLTFDVGFVKFVDPSAKLGAGAIVGIIIACLVILVLILGVIYKFGIQRRKRGNNLAVSYVHDPESRRSNEYTDASRNLTNGTPSSESPNSVGACGGGAAGSSVDDKRIPEETVRLLEADGILYPRNYLTVREIIGQGHFGRVYRGDLALPDKEARDVAVKTLNNLRYRDAEDCEQFLQEGLMMKDFHHHHVLTLIGVAIDDDGFPMVIIPYMANGDLLSYVRNENNYPTVKDLLTYGIHIAEGMKYLSDLKFLHRDLAARNCMLDEDMVVKVADFGLSRDIYERDYYSSDNKKSKLPVKWMAPESLEKGTYGTKSDVWAFGVVLWELLTRGVTPYPEVGNWEILQYVKSGRRMPQPSYCPDMLYNLMFRCWAEDPKLRPSFGELADEINTIIKKMEAKSKHQRVGTKVTYVNYPVEDPGARYVNTSSEELS